MVVRDECGAIQQGVGGRVSGVGCRVWGVGGRVSGVGEEESLAQEPIYFHHTPHPTPKAPIPPQRRYRGWGILGATG
jgi:hypothetical protein